MTELETRIALIEDRLAIMQLEGAYSTTYDSGDGAGWASLFTDDGIYETRGLPGIPEGNFVQGTAALQRFTETNPVRGIHYICVPDLRLDGDDATARVNFQFKAVRTDEHGHAFVTEVGGYYDVAYRRTPGGWRIRRRYTVYFERGQSGVLGYEPTQADVRSENPPLTEGSPYRDRR